MCKETLQASEAHIKCSDKSLSKGFEPSIHEKNKYKQLTDLRKNDHPHYLYTKL